MRRHTFRMPRYARAAVKAKVCAKAAASPRKSRPRKPESAPMRSRKVFQSLLPAVRSLVLGLGAMATAIGAGTARADVPAEDARPAGSIEELTALILSASSEDVVAEALCQLHALSEDTARAVAERHALGDATSADVSVSVSFEGCDVSGSARLVVI